MERYCLFVDLFDMAQGSYTKPTVAIELTQIENGGKVCLAVIEVHH